MKVAPQFPVSRTRIRHSQWSSTHAWTHGWNTSIVDQVEWTNKTLNRGISLMSELMGETPWLKLLIKLHFTHGWNTFRKSCWSSWVNQQTGAFHSWVKHPDLLIKLHFTLKSCWSSWVNQQTGAFHSWVNSWVKHHLLINSSWLEPTNHKHFTHWWNTTCWSSSISLMGELMGETPCQVTLDRKTLHNLPPPLMLKVKVVDLVC